MKNSKNTVEECLSIHAPIDIDDLIDNLRESLKTEDAKDISASYCDWRTGKIAIDTIESISNWNYNYEDENYKAAFISLFKDDKGIFDIPKLNVSQFEGCPHFYGKIYWKSGIYELRQEITEEFLKEGKATGGDWEGYKVGEYTQRFLSRESLNEAFNKIKEKMV